MSPILNITQRKTKMDFFFSKLPILFASLLPLSFSACQFEPIQVQYPEFTFKGKVKDTSGKNPEILRDHKVDICVAMIYTDRGGNKKESESNCTPFTTNSKGEFEFNQTIAFQGYAPFTPVNGEVYLRYTNGNGSTSTQNTYTDCWDTGIPATNSNAHNRIGAPSLDCRSTTFQRTTPNYTYVSPKSRKLVDVNIGPKGGTVILEFLF